MLQILRSLLILKQFLSLSLTSLKIFGAIILLLSCFTNIYGQTERATNNGNIDIEMKKRVIDSIALQLRARYVLPERVPQLEEHLRTKLRNGGYDNDVTAIKFAQALTQDLRTIGDDLHFDVSYNPAREQVLLASGTDKAKILPEIELSESERESLRQTNYGIKRVEVLNGNVGYLVLDSFVNLSYSRDTVVAAMAVLANVDAVIIDLRRNNGGHGNVGELMISYFFGPEPVELMASFDRETNMTTQHRSLRELPGRRLPTAEIFILSSRATASAAEAFAFTLQQVNRGKVVGTRTSGAAHGGGWVPLGNGFIFFVPTFRGFNPHTGKSWNSTGVLPNIEAPDDRTLEIAHLEAVKKLLTKTNNEERRKQLAWLEPLLELKAFGQKQLPLLQLKHYVGEYEGVSISLESEQLYFLGASGIRRRLLALTNDIFLIEDSSVPPEYQARVRFLSNQAGEITELCLLIADGRSFARPHKK
jgi:retinol-binding protein 3